MEKKEITIDQAKDTGLALILILLLAVSLGGKQFLMMPAIVVLVVTMTVPGVFTPLARLWFGLSHALGSVVSRILLSVIFFLVLTPIGAVRRLRGADPMQLRGWKSGATTAFGDRNHVFTRENLEKPY